MGAPDCNDPVRPAETVAPALRKCSSTINLGGRVSLVDGQVVELN
jgi:hypothetical protein